MEYENLREKYPAFIYRNYEIKEDEKNIYLTYHFEIRGLQSFHPMLTIPKKNFKIQNLSGRLVQNLVFHIGMVEAISYYKATCSPYFYVECGKLQKEQIDWFQKLFYLGLGEFRYKNKIQVSQTEFVQFLTEGLELKAERLERDLNDVIIPIGGGKDSSVTLELLKAFSQKRFGFRINLEEVSKQCAKISGLSEKDIIEVNRKIDSNLISLNQQGFLNGHTPFSALVAFLSYFVAVIMGKKYIALSNEDSANEPNIKGENINHQYSKTIEFENDFRAYVKRYICMNGPEYFSFLRPLHEIQIAKLFAELEGYHPIFKSCNVGSKEMPWKWCNNCPKCLFAYIILSPFLEQEKMISIFGENLWEKESLLPTFIELCGYAEQKPFECVGTYYEVQYAISETIRRTKGDLPFLLKYYQNHFKIIQDDKILKDYQINHNLPKELDEILRTKIGID